MSDIRKYIKLLETLIEDSPEGNFSYPDAGKNAPDHVKKAIEEFYNLPEDKKLHKPLLYYILGSGTPPYKMSKEDSKYTDQSKNNNANCSNCEFSYQKVINKKFICSQIRGEIKPTGWCNQWVKGKS